MFSRATNPANTSLRKLLESRVQSARGDESFVLPDELFQTFEMDDMDFNGATCSGYSESGRSFSVSAKVNVAALAGLPGILTCEPGSEL